MKRLISVFLVLVMLLASTVVLSSCSAVKEKSFEKDAQGVISEAFQKAYSSFFTDESGMGEVASAAFESGMMQLSLESETLLGEIDKIEETLYFDKEAKRYVSDTSVTYAGEVLSLRADLLDRVLTLSGESVFGSSTAYAVNFASLLTDMENSHLLSMFGIAEEDIAEMKEALGSLEFIAAENAPTEEEMQALANEVLALMRPVVAEEDLNDTGCVTVTYTLANDTVYAAVRKWIEGVIADEAQRTETIADLDKIWAEIDEDILYTLKLYVAKRSGALLREEVAGSNTSRDAEYPAQTNVSVALDISETEIVISGNVKESAWYQVEDTENAFELKLTKETGKEETKYTFSARTTEDGETKTPFSFSYTYQKATGDFSLLLNAMVDEAEEMESLTVAGKVTVDKASAAFEISSITAGDVTLNVKFSLTFKKDVELPAATSGKNILTLTEAEAEAFLTDLSESKLMQLIEGVQ